MVVAHAQTLTSPDNNFVATFGLQSNGTPLLSGDVSVWAWATTILMVNSTKESNFFIMTNFKFKTKKGATSLRVTPF